MKVIKSNVHAVIDYLVALWLIAFPWVFNLDVSQPQGWVPLALGISVVLYSLLTRYELGAIPIISFSTHLVIDVVGALLLLISPWLFGFADETWRPHVFTAIAEFIVIAMSQRSVSGKLAY